MKTNPEPISLHVSSEFFIIASLTIMTSMSQWCARASHPEIDMSSLSLSLSLFPPLHICQISHSLQSVPEHYNQDCKF
jgi:hypothetical protein